MRVMLVEDSKTMRNIQRDLLARLGHTDIAEACNGEDALSRVDAFDPELLLVDWHLPKLDGIEFVRTCRRRGRTTPIIMVTTQAERARVIEALEAGVDNYVVKPFTPEAFSQRVVETLARAAIA